MPRISVQQAGGQNRCAMLDAIAWSEIGAPVLSASDDGYNVLVGSLPGAVHTFSSYADHPRIHVASVNSDAAGRYQIMGKFWPYYKKLLKLPDFGPLSQDLYAIQQMRESHALSYIDAGNITEAVELIAHIWASLPGAGYNQHENSFDSIKAAYLLAGGNFTA